MECCATLRHLKQHYPKEPTGKPGPVTFVTLAALVSGIVGSKSCHLSRIAKKVPDGREHESRSKRFARFLQNKTVTPETFFLPYAQTPVASLPSGPLVLIMDGSQVGRGCMALMLSVLYEHKDPQGNKDGGQKRALPLCWQIVQAKKGHFPQERHRELVAQAQDLIPPGRGVIFLGDGEFDGPGLLADVTAAGWQYVCRTARNVLLSEADWPDETFTLSQMMADGGLRPGDCVELTDLLFSAQGLGPVLMGAVWEPDRDEPLLLVTSLDFLHEARFWYRKRFGIETLFSDRKSRGFHLGHSHLSDPPRLCRLLIAACLAYYWMVCLGVEVLRHGWQKIIHRTDRCDLSLFQLGLTWLEHCLDEGRTVPVRLQVPPIK